MKNNWSQTNVADFCKVKNKDLRKLKWIQLFYLRAKTKWNLAYLKFDILSQKPFNSFFLAASIQNLCGLFEMKDRKKKTKKKKKHQLQMNKKQKQKKQKKKQTNKKKTKKKKKKKKKLWIIYLAVTLLLNFFFKLLWHDFIPYTSSVYLKFWGSLGVFALLLNQQ